MSARRSRRAPGPADERSDQPPRLGALRVHLQRTDSTNERARELARAGAPHGTLVTAAEQTAGRGRQGRVWVAPPGTALLCSLVLREPPELLSLRAGVATCEAVGEQARLKWPNDVVFERPDSAPQGAAPQRAAPQGVAPPGATAQRARALAKLAGVLVEGRPQQGWAVLGIGVNVAVSLEHLPASLRDSAATLGLGRGAIEPTLARLLEALEQTLREPAEVVLERWRVRDALAGREIAWRATAEGVPLRGRAAGIDGQGRLLVALPHGSTQALEAGEVHITR